jgi:hypothetical protein
MPKHGDFENLLRNLILSEPAHRRQQAHPPMRHGARPDVPAEALNRATVRNCAPVGLWDRLEREQLERQMRAAGCHRTAPPTGALRDRAALLELALAVTIAKVPFGEAELPGGGRIAVTRAVAERLLGRAHQ